MFTKSTFLWWLTGEDPYILTKCSNKTKIKFSIIGLFVVVILLISVVSISYGVYELLESYYTGLIIGIYFAALVLFLYLFILYSLTKNVLPAKRGNRVGKLFSFIIRFSFLIFLGVLTSQPIEYWLFSDRVTPLIEKEIATKIEEHEKRLIKNYTFKLEEKKNLNLSEYQFNKEKTKLKLEHEKRLTTFKNYQYSRNFFIRKMILMDTSESNQHIWIFSSIFVFIFVLPVIIKRRIKLNTTYYLNKRRIQEQLITEHHNWFVKSYNAILQANHKNFSWHTTYKNPPFNTEKIEDTTEFKDDTEFSKWLLNETD